jgi:hypothetical protein
MLPEERRQEKPHDTRKHDRQGLVRVPPDEPQPVDKATERRTREKACPGTGKERARQTPLASAGIDAGSDCLLINARPGAFRNKKSPRA